MPFLQNRQKLVQNIVLGDENGWREGFYVGLVGTDHAIQLGARWGKLQG